jgi:alanyl-tRNA synthetase
VSIPATEKRYLNDPYRTEFRARVVATSPRGARGTAVFLDETYFYPESGGQLADAGSIGGLELADVQESDNDAVEHIVAGEHDLEGEVECRVDWARRYDHMQQHTGQHVLSRAFIDTANLPTVSFHMGDDACTIDLEGGDLDDDAIGRAEARANHVVGENRPVTVRTVPISELDQSELRRKVPDGVQDARIVEIEGFDAIPCCGTHVATTAELRAIKVLKYEKARGNQRVSFLVGGRAVDDYIEKHAILQGLANRLTTSFGDVAARVDKLVEENQAGRRAIRQLAEKLAVVEKDLALAAAETVGKLRLVVRVISDADPEYLRLLSSQIRAADRVIALLATEDGTVICTCSDDVPIDIAGPVVDLARALGGSGGGKGSFAQVVLPRGSDPARFLENVEQDVRHRL